MYAVDYSISPLLFLFVMLGSVLLATCNLYVSHQVMYDLVLTRCIFFKVGSTRKQIAVAYGQKGGKDNIVILENLVTTI